MSKLARLSLLVFVLLAAHTVDHAVNQPSRDLPATSGLVGFAGFAIVAASTVLALGRSPHAPAAGAFAGLATIFGFVVIHLLPRFNDAISDPFWEFSANALSWALLVAPVVAAAALATAGLRDLRAARPAPA